MLISGSYLAHWLAVSGPLPNIQSGALVSAEHARTRLTHNCCEFGGGGVLKFPLFFCEDASILSVHHILPT